MELKLIKKFLSKNELMPFAASLTLAQLLKVLQVIGELLVTGSTLITAISVFHIGLFLALICLTVILYNYPTLTIRTRLEKIKKMFKL